MMNLLTICNMKQLLPINTLRRGKMVLGCLLLMLSTTQPLIGQQTPPPETNSAPKDATESNPDDFAAESDPTTPSQDIARQMQRPVPQVVATTRATAAPLPPLPKITLKAIVLSGPETGTAWIEVEDQLKMISLRTKPTEKKQLIEIPAEQYAEFSPALEQLRDLVEAQKEPTGVEATASKLEQERFDPRTAFSVNGIIFTLESFSRHHILLKSTLHQKLLLLK